MRYINNFLLTHSVRTYGLAILYVFSFRYRPKNNFSRTTGMSGRVW